MPRTHLVFCVISQKSFPIPCLEWNADSYWHIPINAKISSSTQWVIPVPDIHGSTGPVPTTIGMTANDSLPKRRSTSSFCNLGISCTCPHFGSTSSYPLQQATSATLGRVCHCYMNITLANVGLGREQNINGKRSNVHVLNECGLSSMLLCLQEISLFVLQSKWSKLVPRVAS